MDNIQEKKILLLIDRARRFIPFYGFSSRIIEIIFLKYLTTLSDDRLEADDYKLLMRYQMELFGNRLDFSTVEEICRLLDRLYEGRVSRVWYALEALERELKNNTADIVNLLSYFELPSDKKLFKNMILCILDNCEDADRTKTGSYVSSTALVKLASNLLNVKENESFLDPFYGFGKMALNINAKYIEGHEINYEACGLAQMINLMVGDLNVNIYNDDYYSIKHEAKFDKIFIDAPLNLLMDDRIVKEFNWGRKGEAYNIKFSLMNLNENGRAVVAVPGGILTSNMMSYIELRKEIIPYLTGVIALQPLWIGTGIPTYLLVLDKNNAKDSVSFIDATKLSSIEKKRKYILTNQDIKLILEGLENTKDEFSISIDKETLLKSNDIALNPTRYIFKKEENIYRKVSEIEKDLKILYKELNNLIEG